MKRNQLIKYLASVILKKQKDSPILVGIDGAIAAGKSTLINDIENELKGAGRPVIRASIEGFHHPKKGRYHQGKNSPAGYYYDSFNYPAMKRVLLDPLHSGKLKYQTAIFNYKTDSKVISSVQRAKKDSILLMEGIFLFRSQLLNYWDLKIFLDIDSKTTLKRVVKRIADIEYLGTEQAIVKRYNERYLPGQQIYFDQEYPQEKAHIVIDNNDLDNPIITKS